MLIHHGLQGHSKDFSVSLTCSQLPAGVSCSDIGVDGKLFEHGCEGLLEFTTLIMRDASRHTVSHAPMADEFSSHIVTASGLDHHAVMFVSSQVQH